MDINKETNWGRRNNIMKQSGNGDEKRKEKIVKYQLETRKNQVENGNENTNQNEEENEM